MNQSSGLFLAVDQSTSATKAMLFNSEGLLIDQEVLPHRQIYPHAGWVEHDAGEIFTNTVKTTTTLLDRHPDDIGKLLAFSLTNQRETFVVFDRETGQPLHHAIVWQCRRGDEICKRLVDAGHDKRVQDLTGLKIDTYFPASKLSWLLNERPDLRTRIANGSALFGTIDTYLIYRLTGGAVYASDFTNASRTLFFDIEKLGWSQDLCEVFGVKFGALPEVRESSGWYGDTDLAGYLHRRIPICGVMGDSQAAFFAQRCYEPGDVKVTFGTGTSILLNIGHTKRLSTSGMVSALGWVLNGQPTYAYEGIINYTGASIAWLRDQLQLITDPAETETLARSVRDCDGVYFIPAFVGMGAPYWRADVRAAILGMSPSTSRAHVVRAALESIAYVVTDVLKAVGKDGDIRLAAINADGGAVRNSFLMQFVADLTQINLRASRLPDLSALGAVFSGGLGLEIYSSLDDLRKIPTGYAEYNPQIDAPSADQLFAGWQMAVRQILHQPE